MKPTDYPEQRPRLGGAAATATSPSTPTAARATTDYPINDDNSPIKVVNFNGVGGGTILYTAHFPRLHPSDFRVQHARRRRRRLADRLRDARAVLRRERPHDGRRRAWPAIPAYPPHAAADAAAAARQDRRALCGKAMNKLGWHWWPSDIAIATHGLRGPRAAASTSATARRAARRAPRPAPTSPTGRRRSAPASSCAPAAGCARSRPNEHGMASGVDLLRRRGARAVPAGRGGDPGLQRRRHAAPAAELGLGALPERPGQFQRAWSAGT